MPHSIELQKEASVDGVIQYYTAGNEIEVPRDKSNPLGSYSHHRPSKAVA